MKLLLLEQIKPNPHQPRTQADAEKIRELAEDIKNRLADLGDQNGLIHPITVQPDGNSGYIIVAGHRRFAAFQWLASKNEVFREIPAEVVPALEREQDLFELAVSENSQREDLSPQDKTLVIEKAITQFKMTYEQAAKLLGYANRGHAHKLHSLLAIKDQAVWDKINSGELGVEHARLLLPVLKLNDGEEQYRTMADGIKRWGLTTNMVAQNVVNAFRNDGRRVSETRLNEKVDPTPDGCATTCYVCQHLASLSGESWCARPLLFEARFQKKHEPVLQVEPCPACGGQVYYYDDQELFPMACAGCKQAWRGLRDFRVDVNEKARKVDNPPEKVYPLFGKSCPRCHFGQVNSLEKFNQVECPNCSAHWNSFGAFNEEFQAAQKIKDAPGFDETYQVIYDWATRLYPTNAEKRIEALGELTEGKGESYKYFVGEIGLAPLTLDRAAKEYKTYLENDGVILQPKPPVMRQACHICLDPEGVDPAQGFVCTTCGINYGDLIGLSVTPWAKIGTWKALQAFLEALEDKQTLDILVALLGTDEDDPARLAAILLRALLAKKYVFD